MTGKWLIIAGLILVFTGVALCLGPKIGINFGKLPGDMHIQKEKYSIHFPIVTCIVLSIGLTLLINLILWFFRR